MRIILLILFLFQNLFGQHVYAKHSTISGHVSSQLVKKTSPADQCSDLICDFGLEENEDQDEYHESDIFSDFTYEKYSISQYLQEITAQKSARCSHLKRAHCTLPIFLLVRNIRV